MKLTSGEARHVRAVGEAREIVSLLLVGEFGRWSRGFAGEEGLDATVTGCFAPLADCPFADSKGPGDLGLSGLRS